MNTTIDPTSVGVVAIGRNEGARLIACLKSAVTPGRRVIYVDSGSTDGSLDAARTLGAEVVELDMREPFTAARARNAGAERLLKTGTAPEFIQFVDGDCEIVEGWIETAAIYLSAHQKIAAVCGRRREKHPEATLFNRLIDREWATPIGEADACGGDVMLRASAFRTIGGYDPSLIAGEEPEMCVRLRESGWRIMRLEAEMTRHDAAITRFDQWWKRAARAGHAYAEVSSLHAASPMRIWTRETRRALIWAGLAPVITGLTLAIHPMFAFFLSAYPLQVARLALKNGGSGFAWADALLLMLGKFAEASGILRYYGARLIGVRSKLIEYKS